MMSATNLAARGSLTISLRSGIDTGMLPPDTSEAWMPVPRALMASIT